MELAGTIVNQYRIHELIGTGAYGLVFRVEDIYTNEEFAIKVISKLANKSNNLKQSEILLKNLIKLSKFNLRSLNSIDLNKLKNFDFENLDLSYLKEIIIHLKVNNHPNVVTIHEILDSSICLFIVMDYYKEGDLFKNIVDERFYINSNVSLIKSVFIQLIDVLSYLHSKNIYHCDLKPENILCDLNKSKLVISDFGLSVMNKKINIKTCIGSSYYMPPERLITSINQDYDSELNYPADKGDIWSLCIILINLTCMRNPWMKACLNDKTYLNFLKNPNILKDILPINDELFNILKLSLKQNPFERISLFELRKLILNCKSFTIGGNLSIPMNNEDQLNSCLIPTDSYENSYDFNEYFNENLSTLTNASFNINEGYFNKSYFVK